MVGLIIWAIVLAVIDNRPLEQDWAQTYYVYLDENKLNPELVDSDGKVHATADEYEVGFYDVEGVDQPVMVVNYVDEDVNYVTYYWINGEGKNNIGKAILYSPSEVELLYNIADEKTESITQVVEENRRYHVKVCGPQREVLNTLKSIPGVISAELTGERELDSYTYALEAEKGVDIRKPLFYCLSEKNYPLIGLESVGMNLEEVFIRIMDKASR